MIGKLRGLLDGHGEDWLIIDVGGVGYLVHCPTSVLANLPATGEQLELVIDTHVREDMIRLHGFRTMAEKEVFRLLQTVQGVGAKVALAILGTMTPAEVGNAVSFGEKAMFTRVPGIGPKVAERIVSELRNKVALFAGAAPEAVAAGQGGSGGAMGDAISALQNLGYTREAAATAVARVAKDDPEAATETLIRKGLKELATP